MIPTCLALACSIFLLSGCSVPTTLSKSALPVGTLRGPVDSLSVPQYNLSSLGGQERVVGLIGVSYSAKVGCIISYTSDTSLACHLPDRAVMIPWADISCISIIRNNARHSQSVAGIRITTRSRQVHTIPLSAGAIEVIFAGETQSRIIPFGDVISVCTLATAGPAPTR